MIITLLFFAIFEKELTLNEKKNFQTVSKA
jgi:hypothetical protein